MAFLDELKTDAAKVTGDMAEVIKLNSTIVKEEQKIEDCYREIGKIYYKNFAHKNEEIFRSQVENIQASESLILSEVKQMITKIKGLIVCPSCGSGQPLDSVFCSVCGTRLAGAAQISPAPVSAVPTVEEPMVETVSSVEENSAAAESVSEIPVTEAPTTENPAVEEPAQNTGGIVCKICGTPMSEDMFFCINCGTRRI